MDCCAIGAKPSDCSPFFSPTTCLAALVRIAHPLAWRAPAPLGQGGSESRFLAPGSALRSFPSGASWFFFAFLRSSARTKVACHPHRPHCPRPLSPLSPLALCPSIGAEACHLRQRRPTMEGTDMPILLGSESVQVGSIQMIRRSTIVFDC